MNLCLCQSSTEHFGFFLNLLNTFLLAYFGVMQIKQFEIYETFENYFT